MYILRDRKIGPWNITDYVLAQLCSSFLLQGLFDNFDDIVLAAGSAGTAAGLAIANYLTGSKVR